MIFDSTDLDIVKRPDQDNITLAPDECKWLLAKLEQENIHRRQFRLHIFREGELMCAIDPNLNQIYNELEPQELSDSCGISSYILNDTSTSVLLWVNICNYEEVLPDSGVKLNVFINMTDIDSRLLYTIHHLQRDDLTCDTLVTTSTTSPAAFTRVDSITLMTVLIMMSLLAIAL